MEPAPKRSRLEKYAHKKLTSQLGNQDGVDLYQLSSLEIEQLNKIRIRTYLKAGIAGTLGIVLLYIPYHLWKDVLFPTSLIKLPYIDNPVELEVGFLLYSVVLVIIEIAYLTVVNIHVVSQIAHACGCPNPNDKHFESSVNALIAVGLEKKQKELKSIGINPFDGLSSVMVFVYQILLKLKAALSGFLLKVIITKILGRYVLRMFVDLAGIPIYAFWNIWGSRVIMNEARVRVMAPPLINRFVEINYEEFKSQTEYKELIYPALQTISISKRNFHYNHFLLATTMLNKYDVSIKEELDYKDDFLEDLSKMDKRIKSGIGKLIVFGILIDGRLSQRESRCIKKLNNLGIVDYTVDEAKAWAKDYFEGKGLESFFGK